MITRDADAEALIDLADATRAAWGSERAYDRSIRAAALSRVGNRDVRSAALRDRDARIAEFRRHWCAELGAAEGAVLVACAVVSVDDRRDA